MDDAWKLRNSSVFTEELYEQLLDSYRWSMLQSLHACVHEFGCTCLLMACCALGVILTLLIRQACEGKLFNTVAESSETHTYTASSLKGVCSTPPHLLQSYKPYTKCKARMGSSVWVAVFSHDISTSAKMFIHQPTAQTGIRLHTLYIV